MDRIMMRRGRPVQVTAPQQIYRRGKPVSGPYVAPLTQLQPMGVPVQNVEAIAPVTDSMLPLQMLQPQVVPTPGAAAQQAAVLDAATAQQLQAAPPTAPAYPDLPAQINIQDLIAAAQRGYQPVAEPELTQRDRAELLLRMGLATMAAGGQGQDPLTALATAGTSTLTQRDAVLAQKRQLAAQQRAEQQAVVDRALALGLQQNQLDMSRYNMQAGRADAMYNRDYKTYRDQVTDRTAAADRALREADLNLRRNLGYANLGLQEREADLKELALGAKSQPELKPGEYLSAKTKVFEVMRNDPANSRLTPAQFAQLYRESLARNFGKPIGRTADGRIVVAMPAGEPDVTLDSY